MNVTLEQVIRKSIVYTYVASQPLIATFALPVNSEPVEPIISENHSESIYAPINKDDIWYGENWTSEQYAVIAEQLDNQIEDQHHYEFVSEVESFTISEIKDLEENNYLSIIEENINSIQPGMKTDEINEVQEALASLDYYTGEIDGIYGPLTYEALVKLEKDFDLSLIDEDHEARIHEIYVEPETSESEEDANTVTTGADSARVDDNNEETYEDDVRDNNDEQKEESNEEPHYSKQLDVSGDKTSVVTSARSLVGTPYVYGGTSPGGFDCSGFIQYVFESNDMVVPRTVNELWNYGSHVDVASVGDIVFFATTHSGPSHAGIYIGDGQFIHAGSSNGVEVTDLSNPYWEERYLGAKRM